MTLTDDMLREFNETGFLLIPHLFSMDDIRTISASVPEVFAQDGPQRVLETDGKAVRSVFGAHTTTPTFRRLVQDPRLVEPAMKMLESMVYVHQFKINAKLALVGDIWEWHQDYYFWQQEDGMPTDRALSAALFLNEVHEFNGPLILIPGSHKDGALQSRTHSSENDATENGSGWISTLTAKLKYCIDKDILRSYVDQFGLIAPKGPTGSVLFFHSNLIHASAPNMSPDNRIVIFISYNSIDNKLHPVSNPRPEFIAARDFAPIIPSQTL